MTLPLVGIYSDGYGAGKDSVANVLCKEFGFMLFGFSEVLKEAVYNELTCERFDTLEEWLEYVELHKYDTDEQEGFWVRKLLQSVGAFKRSINHMYWVDAWESRVRPELASCPVVVPSVRFADSEAIRIRELGGVFIKVIRPGIKVDSDPSENGMRDWEPEYIIVNDGTLEDLAHRTRIVAEFIFAGVPNLSKVAT